VAFEINKGVGLEQKLQKVKARDQVTERELKAHKERGANFGSKAQMMAHCNIFAEAVYCKKRARDRATTSLLTVRIHKFSAAEARSYLLITR